MRYLTVMGEKKKVPKFPHHKDYVYRCQRFFEAKTIFSFASIANFRIIKEAYRGFKYQCAVPRDILIDPTSACNINCHGCWAGDYDNHKHLSYEKLDEVISEAKKLGTMDILMTGGEPLLRKNDIVKLAAKHRQLFFGVFTNGILVDEELADQMVQLENLNMFVSIEGFREDTDFRRGEGSFDKAIRAMRLLKAHDMGFGFSLCYHRKNYKTVTSDKFLDYLREQGAWFGWAFGYRPLGKNSDVSLCLNAEERAYVRNRINHYCERHDFTIIDLFNNGHKAYGCVGAGNGYIHINASGDVEPCAFCHYSDSNINHVSLTEALRSPFFRAFRNAQPFSNNSLRPCPMMDVPDAIVKVVEENGARSTHVSSPESAAEFSNKVKEIAKEWEIYAKKEYQNLSPKELRRYNFLLKYLALKRRLSGDAKRKNYKTNIFY